MEDKSTPPWGGPPPQPAGLGSDYGKPRPPECDDDGGMIWPIACIVAFFAFIGSLGVRSHWSKYRHVLRLAFG
jgi:hypothetical protein